MEERKRVRVGREGEKQRGRESKKETDRDDEIESLGTEGLQHHDNRKHTHTQREDSHTHTKGAQSNTHKGRTVTSHLDSRRWWIKTVAMTTD